MPGLTHAARHVRRTAIHYEFESPWHTAEQVSWEKSNSTRRYSSGDGACIESNGFTTEGTEADRGKPQRRASLPAWANGFMAAEMP